MGVAMAMAFTPKTVYVGRINKGADIITAIETFCTEKAISAGWVNILGALNRVTLSYYDQQAKKYNHTQYVGGYEIVSCMGNISIKDDKPFAHLHLVLSDSSDQTIGGHLWPDSVSVFAAEFSIFALSPEESTMPGLLRQKDAETGLSLWGCRL
ncbi:MAG: PPC domain-containing DNA-binding protein [Cyanobacteria bacterium P01_H01_bin.74]